MALNIQNHSEKNTEKALQLLHGIFKENIENLTHYFTEQGHLLYIRIDLKEKIEKELLQKLLTNFKQNAAKILPSAFYDSKGKLENYGWMVDVYYNNFGIDVMTPDISSEN